MSPETYVSKFRSCGLVKTSPNQGMDEVTIGKSLGTLTGTSVGTQVADSNTVIVQLFGGTVGGVSQPAAGSVIRGTVVAQVQGV